jgi:AcrR family transcriptional regulator
MGVRKELLSPKQLHRREDILRAARRILLTGGPASCTSRAVAEECGLNKGLIHYYFETVDEVIDEAMRGLLAELFDRLRATAERHLEPRERFWAVVEDYVAAYAEQPQLTLLWFDYWVRAIRAGRREEVETANDGLVALLTELLSDTSVADPDVRARAVLAYVIGVLVRQEVHPLSFSELRAEIASLSQVRA